MKTNKLSERATAFQNMINTSNNGNNHIDKAIIKIMEENRELADKENGEKLTKFWTLSYYVASVLGLLVEEVKDYYDKMGFRSGKPERMLDGVLRDLDKYFEHTKRILHDDRKLRVSEAQTEDERLIEHNRISNDFEKIYNMLVTFAEMKDERMPTSTPPRQGRTWTTEKVEQLKELYKLHPASECANIMNITESSVRYAIGRYKLSNINAKIRQAEQIKNINGREDSEIRDAGYEHVESDGYTVIKTCDGKWMPKQRHVWEQVYGKIPNGHNVQFKDGNNSNFDIDNLYLITREDAMIENSFNRYPNELRNAINNIGRIERLIKEQNNE